MKHQAMLIKTTKCFYLCGRSLIKYFNNELTHKPQPIMLNFLPIMLLSNAQKFAYYAQYYAHDYCNYAIVSI